MNCLLRGNMGCRGKEKQYCWGSIALLSKTLLKELVRKERAFPNWPEGEEIQRPIGHLAVYTASNQSVLKEISPSLEGLMLKLKLQYFGHLMRRTDSLEKTLMVGHEGEHRGWDDWMASPTQWTWVWVSSGNWWWTGKPGVPQSKEWGMQRVRHDWATELILY